MPESLTAVMPFSDGLDSRIVADLMARKLGDSFVRVRLGTNKSDKDTGKSRRFPFTSIPYHVRPGRLNFRESSARSRGFKFALISGLAAYLGNADRVVVPESGQGALGPALVTVGQAYEDYRTHPLFTVKMEKLLAALFGHTVRFEFPRLWYTKGESLRKLLDECADSPWAGTRSCWQQSRQVSVDKKKRQCGVCAACMLRRMSVHAAGRSEAKCAYVWENLSARSFPKGAAPSFPEKKITPKMRDYAIAGALHLDHLAALSTSQLSSARLDLQGFQLGRVLGLQESDVREKLQRLLGQHAREWRGFIHSIGDHSFVAQWAIYGAYDAS